MVMALSEEEIKAIEQRLEALRIEHSDLDDVISRLGADPNMDQLRLSRLKKRKLALKDAIARLESKLIPDIQA